MNLNRLFKVVSVFLFFILLISNVISYNNNENFNPYFYNISCNKYGFDYYDVATCEWIYHPYQYFTNITGGTNQVLYITLNDTYTIKPYVIRYNTADTPARQPQFLEISLCNGLNYCNVMYSDNKNDCGIGGGTTLYYDFFLTDNETYYNFNIIKIKTAYTCAIVAPPNNYALFGNLTIGNTFFSQTDEFLSNTIPDFNLSYNTYSCDIGNLSNTLNISIDSYDAESDTIYYSLNKFTSKLTTISDFVRFEKECKADYEYFNSGLIEGNFSHNNGNVLDFFSNQDILIGVDTDCNGYLRVFDYSEDFIIKPSENLYNNWHFTIPYISDNNNTNTEISIIDSLQDTKHNITINHNSGNITVLVNGVTAYNKNYFTSSSTFIINKDIIELNFNISSLEIKDIISNYREVYQMNNNFSLYGFKFNILDNTGSNTIYLNAYSYEYSQESFTPLFTTVKPTTVYPVYTGNNNFRLYVTDNIHLTNYSNYEDFNIYLSSDICVNSLLDIPDGTDIKKLDSVNGFFFLLKNLYGMGKLIDIRIFLIIQGAMGFLYFYLFFQFLFYTNDLFKAAFLSSLLIFFLGLVGLANLMFLITSVIVGIFGLLGEKFIQNG